MNAMIIYTVVVYSLIGIGAGTYIWLVNRAEARKKKDGRE